MRRRGRQGGARSRARRSRLDGALGPRRARADGALLRPLHALPGDRRARLAADRRRQRLDRHFGLCRRARQRHRRAAQHGRRAGRASSSTSSPRSRRSRDRRRHRPRSSAPARRWSRCRSSAQAVGVDLPPTLHVQPLLVAAGVGLLTAFAFSYLPLQQAQTISPVTLFRSKGLAAPPIDWAPLLALVSHRAADRSPSPASSGSPSS